MNSASPSDYDKENIADIIGGMGTWFSAHLIRLISKADHINRELLRQVFPDHVEAYEKWERR